MAGLQDIRSNFSELENRIQKLISLQEQLKTKYQGLISDHRRLQIELEEQKAKSARMEEGYKNLKEMEDSGTRQSIARIKTRIHDIIGDIEKNISLIDINQ
ncbi:MAG: hypothetical protein IT242_11760 [Bacteroidia bacterium]|nr:hypothetical protein [Bacteroidia bacterium]